MAIDVASIKAALKMADSEWARNGLIASDSEINKAGGGEFLLMRHLDANRGLYPSSFGTAVDSADEIVGNLIFSLANTMVSQLSARDPEPLVRPHGGTAARPLRCSASATRAAGRERGPGVALPVPQQISHPGFWVPQVLEHRVHRRRELR